MFKPATLHLLLLIVSLQTNLFAFAQDTSFSANEWAKKLKANDDTDNKCLYDLISLFNKKLFNEKDTSFVIDALNQLEKNLSTNHYFNGRFYLIKINVRNQLGESVEHVKKFCEMALKEAYQTDDDNFIAHASYFTGGIMGLYQEIELSVTYYLLADEILQHLEKKPWFSNSLILNLGKFFTIAVNMKNLLII